MSNIKIIVFSRNRPLQLYSLLESLSNRCLDLDVVDLMVSYRADSDDILDLYNEISESFPRFSFCKRESIYADVFNYLFIKEKAEYCSFLVDDIIFTRDFKFSDSFDVLNKNKDSLAFSLRLGHGINYCYSMDRETPEPSFLHDGDGYLKWKTENSEGDWSYCISIDGNIFRTADLLEAFFSEKPINFSSPNTLESSMFVNSYRIKQSNTCSFPKPVLVNIPNNRVQNEFQNRHEGNSHHDLCETWRDGYKIDIEKYKNLENNSCHYPMELFLKRRAP